MNDWDTQWERTYLIALRIDLPLHAASMDIKTETRLL